MNKCILMGRLTRDPEIRYTQGDNSMAVMKFTLAVDRRAKKDAKQEADFITCAAFGKTAEVIDKYCSKGSKIAVSGRIQTGSYTNKDGNKVYTTDVMVEEFDFCEGRKDSATKSEEPKQETPKKSDGFMNVPEGVEDSGLPFN